MVALEANVKVIEEEAGKAKEEEEGEELEEVGEAVVCGVWISVWA